MNSFERDLCGAIIGAALAGPRGAILGVIICHTLFPDE